MYDTSGNNSFEEDTPNGVLTHTEEQKTYKITLLSRDLETATFNLELLPGETHNLNTVTGRMNLFVDSQDSQEDIGALEGELERQWSSTSVPRSSSSSLSDYDDDDRSLTDEEADVDDRPLPPSPFLGAP